MTKKLKILMVFGTRPEVIKVAPLLKAFQKSEKLEVSVCVTGQHLEMLEPLLTFFGIHPEHRIALHRSSKSLTELTAGILSGMEKVLQEEKPDVVLVQGDTTSSFAGALAAFYKQIPVVHVEAGLRTHHLDSPFPEEFNRQTISKLSELDFAPTEENRRCLLNEGKPPERIFVTGNTAIDALRLTVQKEYQHPILEWAKGSRLVVLTAHRRENLGAPMARMFSAIRRVLEVHPDVKVVYPVHINNVVQELAQAHFAGVERIRLVKPLDVVDFHNIIARCYLVVTDSGGIQEEAPFFHRPVVVIRDSTERSEGVEAGTLCLAGTREKDILDAVHRLLTDKAAYQRMAEAVNPYGDGHASDRIAVALESFYLEKPQKE